MLDGATLDNQVAATLADSYSGYGLYLYDGAVFDNEAGARFTFLTNAQISGDGSGSILPERRHAHPVGGRQPAARASLRSSTSRPPARPR